MAEEQVVNEVKTAPPAEEPKKKSPLKSAGGFMSKLGFLRIPALIIAVIILAIVTGLITSKMLGGKADATEKKVEAKAEKKELGKFVSLDPFTVNLAGGVNYLQAAVAFEIENEGGGGGGHGESESELEKEIKERKPQINDVIITILSSKTIEEISEVPAREQLKLEIQKAVDSLLTCGKIERVYFTTFIMQ